MAVTNPQRIAVLGAGSWGGTLAVLLLKKGHHVSLWEFDPKVAEQLAKTRRLPVLPDLVFPQDLEITSDIRQSLTDRPVIISATPSHFVRSTMKSAKASGAVRADAVVISVSKGLEEGSTQRMTEVIREELGLGEDRLAVLSGPSHAEEVCRDLPTAVVVASHSEALALRAQEILMRGTFRVYTHTDPVGVEIGGAIKNIFAIATGACDGLELGDNTKAALLTRGLMEMARLGVKRGAKRETFFGLAGMGDLVVTCLSRHSRNRLLGEKIGKGKALQEALREMPMVAEGVKTTKAAHELAEKLGLDLPIIREVYRVLYERKDPHASMRDLMLRQAHPESFDV